MNLQTIILYSLLFLTSQAIQAQNTPTLTYEQMRRMKFTSSKTMPIKKQVVPYQEKVAIRFPELGKIYNPNFPATRNKVAVANFYDANQVISKNTSFTYIGKSLSTNRATVFIQNEGTYYSVWYDGKCKSLIQYKVARVGDNLEITGQVYACVPAS